MSYTKTVWNDDKAPFIEASNLNKMEEGIKSACDGVDALNIEMDAVDENLGNKNLKTYTDLSQIGCSVNNTITEVMTALPQSSELIVGTWSSVSTLNTSLGIGGASGILTCRKFNADRGDVVWRRTQAPATIYTLGWHNGTLTSQERIVTNSDLLGLKLKEISATLSSKGTTYYSIGGDVAKTYVLSFKSSAVGANVWTNLMGSSNVNYIINANNNGTSQIRIDTSNAIAENPIDIRMLVGYIQ